MYDAIVIGGGPAGITAGIYLARKNLKAVIITKDFMGQTGTTASIENWPGIKNISGPELMTQFKNHLEAHEIEIKEGEMVLEINKEEEGTFSVLTGKKEKIEAKVVLICSGRNPRSLQVVGESEYIGKGVVYCAICDAPLFNEKPVAVIGGGNAGFETAIEMAERKCPKVYILQLRANVVADEILQKKASKFEAIEVITRAMLKEIKGKDFVESIVYQDLEKNEEKELFVKGVFVEIGSVPVTGFVKDLVEFNDGGEIKINHSDCTTKTPGVFAAGDVTDVPYKQVVIATGEGSKAALSAYDYIKEK